MSGISEKCGVAAVIAPPGKDGALLVVKIGEELQHRGQEAGGVGTKRLGGEFHLHKDGRRFGSIFYSPTVLRRHSLKGELALAHTRYCTTGSHDDCLYSHPIQVGSQLMGIHNGNIANYPKLWEDLKGQGIELDTDGGELAPSDSEILFRRIAISSGGDWPEKVARAMEGVEGSCSAIVLTDQDECIAFRDPWGIRPLSFGRIDGHFVVASETAPLNKVRAVDITEVSKGEMWVFRSGEEPKNIVYDNSKPWKRCDFENWYFLWPSSMVNGVEASLIRELTGCILSEEEKNLGRKISADLVTGIPDTGRTGAITFANELGLPYQEKVFKARYDGKGNRSFIGSSDLLRGRIIEDKYCLSPSLQGKRVYFGDDSSIRFNTARRLNLALRDMGVREIHNRFFSPKFVRPCFLGTDISNRTELGAMKKIDGVWVVKNDKQIAQETGADSVAFLSMEGRREAYKRIGMNPDEFCGYCHGDTGPDMKWDIYDPEKIYEKNHLFPSRR